MLFSTYFAALNVHPICTTSSLQVLGVLVTMGTSLIAVEGALSTMAKTSSKAAEVARLLSLKDMNDVRVMKAEAEEKNGKDEAQAQKNRTARNEGMKKWCCHKAATANERTPPLPTTFAGASAEAKAKAKAKAADAKVCKLNLVIGTSNLEKTLNSAEAEARKEIKDMAKGLAEKTAKAMAKGMAEEMAKEMAKEIAKQTRWYHPSYWFYRSSSTTT